jgi:hypothetical protein
MRHWSAGLRSGDSGIALQNRAGSETGAPFKGARRDKSSGWSLDEPESAHVDVQRFAYTSLPRDNFDPQLRKNLSRQFHHVATEVICRDNFCRSCVTKLSRVHGPNARPIFPGLKAPHEPLGGNARFIWQNRSRCYALAEKPAVPISF